MLTVGSTPVPVDRVLTLAGDVEKVYERMTVRVYEYFVERGCINGYEIDDWLRAENELLVKPRVELRREDRAFIVEMVLPDLDFKDLHIRVTPREMLVTSPQRQGQQIYRVVRFPEEIDFTKVDAGFAGNTLRVIAATLAECKAKSKTCPVPVVPYRLQHAAFE